MLAIGCEYGIQSSVMRNQARDLSPKISVLHLTGKPAYDVYVRAANEQCGDSITPSSLFTFFENARKRYSKSTLSLLKAALRKSVKLTLLHDAMSLRTNAAFANAFAEMKISRQDSAVLPDVIFSELELERLARSATPRLACVMNALSATGCRVSEIVNAPLSSCRSDGKIVTIRVNGKGSEPRDVYMEQSQFDSIRSVYNGKIFLFETRNGKALNRKYVWKQMSRLGRIVLKRRLTPHCSRHSFATAQLLEKGRSIKAVSRYLGHKNVTTCLKFYIHDQLTAEELFPARLTEARNVG